MRKATPASALVILALLGGVAGCGDRSTAEETTAATTALPEPSPPPFPVGTRPSDGGQGSGNGLGLTGVQASHVAGYDRVVFELGGTGTPGWRVEYTADPVYEGSGKPVTLEGTVYLSVVLRGFGLPLDTGLAPYGDDTTRLPGTGTRSVAEIVPGGVFEGEQGAFIGLAGARRPFRVFALTDPTRVVVDVRDLGRTESAADQ